MFITTCIPDMLKRCFPLMRRGPTASRRTIGDIRHPDLVRVTDIKVAFYEVGNED